jgi:hypothetical protein
MEWREWVCGAERDVTDFAIEGSALCLNLKHLSATCCQEKKIWFIGTALDTVLLICPGLSAMLDQTHIISRRSYLQWRCRFRWGMTHSRRPMLRRSR